MTIKVNGNLFTTSKQSERYIDVERVWRDGDRIEVTLPMSMHAEPLPGSPNIVALLYGPIVLAGRLGKKGLAPGTDIIINERTIGDVLKDEVTVPRLRGDVEKVLQQVKRSTDSSLAFRTEKIGDPFDVDLIPYFRMAHERYSMYWRVGE